MAGNEKSGNVIAFRMSESELSDAIQQFRVQYGDGSKGMVTWERFCAFIGYSADEVKECYQRGREKASAYYGRSKLLEKFETECRAMMFETCGNKLALCNKLAARDMLRDTDKEGNEKTFRISFGGNDERAKKARL